MFESSPGHQTKYLKITICTGSEVAGQILSHTVNDCVGGECLESGNVRVSTPCANVDGDA